MVIKSAYNISYRQGKWLKNLEYFCISAVDVLKLYVMSDSTFLSRIPFNEMTGSKGSSYFIPSRFICSIWLAISIALLYIIIWETQMVDAFCWKPNVVWVIFFLGSPLRIQLGVNSMNVVYKIQGIKGVNSELQVRLHCSSHHKSQQTVLGQYFRNSDSLTNKNYSSICAQFDLLGFCNYFYLFLKSPNFGNNYLRKSRI